MKPVLFILPVCMVLLLISIGDSEAKAAPQGEFTKLKPRSVEELKLDKLVYEEYCGNCHELKKPNSKTEEEWRVIVPRMVAKAKKTEDMAINAISQERIMQYLLTMCQTNTKR